MNPIRAWNQFWFRPVSARPLGAMRILFGLIALFNLALLAVDLDYWLTDAGMLQGGDASEVAGPLRFSVFLRYQDPTTVRAVFAAIFAVATFFTVGFCTRVMSVLLYVGMLMIHHRDVASTSGADVLLMTYCFHFLFSNAGRAYSVDAWLEKKRRGGTVAEPLVWPITQRLVQIQICIVYTIAAIAKFTGTTWLSGTAMHFVLFNTEVRRLDFTWLADYPVLVNLLTYWSLALEMALIFLLWVRAARKWVILQGIALHLGIMFVINIPVFGELMMLGYLSYLKIDEWDATLNWLAPRRITAWLAERSGRLGTLRPGIGVQVSREGQPAA